MAFKRAWLPAPIGGLRDPSSSAPSAQGSRQIYLILGTKNKFFFCDDLAVIKVGWHGGGALRPPGASRRLNYLLCGYLGGAEVRTDGEEP